ncbi:hypothetical protein OKW30_007963 [Paraburkholderia sp. Clong3]|uniref:nuclease-related domain-containing protein n=1 Tax=Paraburkholderia sp. Clong3 TaxID=2991061 RepID=UPI003D215AF5
MLTYILLVSGCVFAWRALTRQRKPNSSNPPATRNQKSGDEGEARVQADLRSALQWLCGENFYLHPGALLLNHAPGTEFPTAELDHLAITPFGIFVIETKNWAGSILPGADAETVVRVGVDGQRETRRSPLRQNRSKVGFLRGVLPRMWPVEGLGVFASDRCEVSAALPANLIRRADLHQWLRARKIRHDANGSLPVNVHHAWRAIQAVAVTDDAAIHAHRINVMRSA